jgi:hypothetical protein
VIGLCCHRHQRSCPRQLDASVEASEPHDFAVRVGAVRQQHIRVHRIPSRVRDDREPPLLVGRDGGLVEVIWVGAKRNYFCNRDWTPQITLIRFNKSVFCENAPPGKRGYLLRRLDSDRRHFVNRGHERRVCPLRRPIYGVRSGAKKSRTHSSAGERSLHTGEVQGSIPCASTRDPPKRLERRSIRRLTIAALPVAGRP